MTLTELDAHIAVNRRMLERPKVGAVAHYLKAVAKQRGWRNGTRGDSFTINDRLARETDSPRRIPEIFAIFREHHVNFYEISHHRVEVKHGINAAKEFIDMLGPAGIAGQVR